MAGKLEVDSKGMRQKVAHRGIRGAAEELISNAFDEKVTFCHVGLKLIEGRQYELRVEDDSPEGFRNLKESYTLFASSYKAALAESRGRFNLGEKVAIVLANEATIVSTTGRVTFTNNDTKHTTKVTRERGTVFIGRYTSTIAEIEETLAALRDIIAPVGVEFTINEEVMPNRKPVRSFRATLASVIEKEVDGLKQIVPTRRETTVLCYEVLPGEVARIYEMGIPVVKPGTAEDNEPFHINIMQKVPLNMDRDNVTPAFLREVRRAVLNNTHEIIPLEKLNYSGVIMGMEGASVDAVEDVLDRSVGKKRAFQDPRDRESEDVLKGDGFTIVPTRMFPPGVNKTIKDLGLLERSGDIRPTPKPYSDDPNAPTVKMWPDDKVTPAMQLYREYVATVAREVLGKEVHFRWVDTRNSFSMCCGAFGNMISYDVNVRDLGVAWFDRPVASTPDMVDITIHELGHYDGSGHLSSRYYDNLTMIGGKLAVLALDQPKLFRKFRKARDTDLVSA